MSKIGSGPLLLISGAIIGVLASQLIQAKKELAQQKRDFSTKTIESDREDDEVKEEDEGKEKKEEKEERPGEIIVGGEETTSSNHTSETKSQANCPQCNHNHDAQQKRERLPKMIILVRHGQSQGNADHTLYRSKPDNLVELTKKGIKQAHRAGKKVEWIFRKADYESELEQHLQQQEEHKASDHQEHGEGTSQLQYSGTPSYIKRVHLIVSPFERTRQTAAAMRPWFGHRVVRTDVQPRIREQEFGNLQGHDFEDFRREQKRVGRFWYRFPTGESGSDVYDRVKSWWHDSVLNVNERYGYEPVDALVVVTHGLTMRFVLMQLFGWSPTTFHSVWNAENCQAYVLKKDLSKPGMSPFVLDEEVGDMPKSSIDLQVEFNSHERRIFKLNDYLRIPPPRTQQLDLVKAKLEEQYPEIDKENIRSVLFLPFMDGAVAEQRTRCGRRASLSSLHADSTTNLYQHPPQQQQETRREKRFYHANSSEGLDSKLCAEPEKSWQF